MPTNRQIINSWFTQAQGDARYLHQSANVQSDGTIQSKTSGVFPLLLKAFGASATTVIPPSNNGLMQQGPDGANFSTGLYALGGTAIIAARRGNGTGAAPAALNSGDVITYYSAGGFDGAAWSGTRGSFQVNAAENWNSTSHGTELVFNTTLNGTTSNRNVGKFLNTGVFYAPFGVQFGSTIIKDFEEGTCSFSIQGSLSNPTGSPTSAYGTYQRIGKTAIVEGTIVCDNGSGGSGLVEGSGDFVLAGLPFPPEPSTHGAWSIWGTGLGATPMFLINSGSGTLKLIPWNSGAFLTLASFIAGPVYMRFTLIYKVTS